MNHQDPNTITVLFGHCEVRAWIETELTPSGALILRGMGSRTEYDRDGTVIDYHACATGVVGRMN